MSLLVADLYARLGVRPDASAWEKAQGLVRGLALGLTDLSVYAVAKTGRALLGVAEDAMNAAEKLDDLQQRTKVSAQFLQAFAFAAGSPTGKLEEVGTAVTKLGLALDGAIVNKSDPLRSAFAKLGISMNDPAVKARDLEAITLKVSKGLALMENGTEKLGVVSAIYGAKLGPSLIKPLNELSEKTAQFQKLGGGLTDKQVKELENASGGVEDLASAWELVKLRAGAALGPPIIAMTSKAMEWLEKNRDKITKWIATASNFVLKALAQVSKWGAKIIEWLQSDDAEKFWQKMKEGGELALVVIQGVISVVGGIAAVFESVGTWIGESIAKLVLFGEAIGGFVFDMKEKFLSGIRAIRNAFASMFNWIGDKFKWIADKTEWVFKKLNIFKSYDETPQATPLELTGQDSTFARNLMSLGDTQMIGATPRGSTTNNVQGANVNVTVNTSASNVEPIISKQIQEGADRLYRDMFANLAGATP